jgi:hypothetical protein
MNKSNESEQTVATCGHAMPARAWLIWNTNPYSYTPILLSTLMKLLQAEKVT